LDAINTLWTMPGLQHALDSRGGRGHVLRAGYGKVDLANISGGGEEPADRVGDQHGVFLDVRLSERIYAFPENSDDGEGKAAAELDHLAHRLLGRAIEFLR